MNSTPGSADDAAASEGGDRDPAALAAAARGEIDTALFTKTGRGELAAESYLADRPPVSYLRDGERPQYLLPGESLTVRRHDGAVAIPDDRAGVYTTEGGYRAAVLVTDERIVFLVGQSTGDDVVVLPFWRVAAADGESRQTNERLTITDDRYDYVFTAATDTGVASVADYLRERAVPASPDGGVRPGDHEFLPTELTDYAPADATLESAVDGDLEAVRSDLAWLVSTHLRLATTVADDETPAGAGRLLEPIEELLSVLQAVEDVLAAAQSGGDPDPDAVRAAVTAVDGTPIDNSALTALTEETTHESEAEAEAEGQPVDTDTDLDEDPFTLPEIVSPSDRPPLEDDAPALKRELQRLVGTLHRIPSRADVIEESEYDIERFEQYGDDWPAVLRSAGYDLRERMIEHLQRVDDRYDRIVTPTDLTGTTYRAERYIEVFGGWGAALSAVGLDSRRGRLLAAIQRCRDQSGGVTDGPTLAEHTEFEEADFVDEFGSVRAAVTAAEPVAARPPERDGDSDENEEPHDDSDTADGSPPRSPLSEWYEAVYSLSKLQRAIYDGDPSAPESDPGSAWVTAVAAAAGSDGLDGWDAGYGEQHRSCADHTARAYRDAYGDGDRVTDFAVVETVEAPQSILSLAEGVDGPVPLPVAPDSETPLPVVVSSADELERARRLLTELPSRPAATLSTTTADDESDETADTTEPLDNDSEGHTEATESPTAPTVTPSESNESSSESGAITDAHEETPSSSVDDAVIAELTTITPVDRETARTLAAAGYDSVEALASATEAELCELDGITDGRAFRITLAVED